MDPPAPRRQRTAPSSPRARSSPTSRSNEIAADRGREVGCGDGEVQLGLRGQRSRRCRQCQGSEHQAPASHRGDLRSSSRCSARNVFPSASAARVASTMVFAASPRARAPDSRETNAPNRLVFSFERRERADEGEPGSASRPSPRCSEATATSADIVRPRSRPPSTVHPRGVDGRRPDAARARDGAQAQCFRAVARAEPRQAGVEDQPRSPRGRRRPPPSPAAARRAPRPSPRLRRAARRAALRAPVRPTPARQPARSPAHLAVGCAFLPAEPLSDLLLRGCHGQRRDEQDGGDHAQAAMLICSRSRRAARDARPPPPRLRASARPRCGPLEGSSHALERAQARCGVRARPARYTELLRELGPHSRQGPPNRSRSSARTAAAYTSGATSAASPGSK